MKKIFYLFVLLLPRICVSQDNTLLLKSTVFNKCINDADLVIEGRVLSATGYRISTGQIYTSVIVKITKLFKGSITDSVVELVYYGGVSDSFAVFSSGGFSLSKGMEGIFAMQDNKTVSKLTKGPASYFEPILYVKYIDKKYRGPGNHPAFWKGLTFDNLEKDLFEPIEAITKTPRKVLGLNMFEQDKNKR